MDREALLNAFRRDVEGIVAAAEEGLTTSLPSCPGWTVANVPIHLGGVYGGWVAVIEANGDPWPLDVRRQCVLKAFPQLVELFEKGEKGQPALDPPSGLMNWFRREAAQLEDTLRRADLEARFWLPPDWPLLGEPTNAVFLRAASSETAIHRWDAQKAHGIPDAVDKTAAEVGIDNFLRVGIPGNRWYVRDFRKQPAREGQGESYSLRQTDGAMSWTVTFRGDDAAVVQGATGDVVVSGASSDLLLFLWHRIPAGSLSVAGDVQLLDRFFELAPPL